MSKNILEKYKNIEILGTGQFGNVYKVKYNNEYFAIKEIKKIDEFLIDTQVMKKMECENLVKVIESVKTKDSFYIISELCHLNLEKYLKTKKEGLLIEEIKELLIDLNKGLKVMYENKIILEILNLQIFYYHSTIIM
jgi:serine/threonine protein kinase